MGVALDALAEESIQEQVMRGFMLFDCWQPAASAMLLARATQPKAWHAC
jgi:hypothetical protein